MKRVVAIGLASATLVVTAAGLTLILLGWGVPLADSWGFRGFTAIFAVTGTAVGLLIALNRPDHRVGWLLLGAGALSALQFFGDEYSIYSFFAGREPLPAASWLGWLNAWIWVPGVATIATLAPLYFPDGRLPSPAWRWAVWVAVAATVFTAGSAMADPLQIATNMRGAPPPYDPRAFGPIAEKAGVLFGFIGFPLITVAAFAGAASVVRRFRRARGAERQQIKWFAFGAMWMAIAAAVNVVAQIVFGLGAATVYGAPGLWKIAEYFLIAAFAFVIVSVGLAILRYRLYDVDLVINRTVVYGTLSAVLAATYLVLVVLFQALLRPFTGGSEIAVAASTLATLALVQPLRMRIKDAIDRRFYRSRYDAVRTLDELARRLRDEVDLDAVRSDVLEVVGTTLSPAHAGVWLRNARP